MGELHEAHKLKNLTIPATLICIVHLTPIFNPHNCHQLHEDTCHEMTPRMFYLNKCYLHRGELYEAHKLNNSTIHTTSTCIVHLATIFNPQNSNEPQEQLVMKWMFNCLFPLLSTFKKNSYYGTGCVFPRLFICSL